MTICEPGDVAIVPFPFTDMAVAKPRPALALSARTVNANSGYTVFAMITTAARSRWPQDVPLQDAAAAGLQAESIMRGKLFTLDNRLISRTIGRISRRDRAAMRAVLKTLVAL
jgi:mRNA interferase MazF